MVDDIISPELALVDPVAAAAHRLTLPVVIVDSALRARTATAAASVRSHRVSGSPAIRVWLAVTIYVAIKVAGAVALAIAFIGFVVLVTKVVLG
jgi:hypothetical protein